MDTCLDDGPARQNHRGPALVLYPLAHMGVEIYNSILSIMWPLLAARFGLGYSLIGVLTMIFRGSSTLPQLGFAAVCDRYGSRALAIGGLVLMAVGMSLVGVAPSIGILAIILALAPLGSAAFHPAGTAHMSQAWPRRRGLAVAVFMLGGSIGTSLGPVIGAWLYSDRPLSVSLRLMPLGLAIALLMVFLIPRDGRPVERRTQSNGSKASIPLGVWLVMAASVSVSWIENALTTYLPLLMTARNLPLDLASRVLFAYSASAAGGVLVGGVLSDRVPRWAVILAALCLSAPLYAATVQLGGQGTLLVPAALGFASALSHPTTVALAQELMPERSSLASALTMGTSWVIGSLGVTLTGVLADVMGVQPALLLNAGLPLLGAAAMLVVYRLGRRRRLSPAS